ncbi:MAG: vWA domain-containing protein [Myxococcota bacterium]|jgi:hypothetical protein
MRRLLSALVLAGALAAGPAAATEPQPPPPADEAKPAPGPVKRPDGRPLLEVAFVLDTTGSMGGLLEGAKQKIWSIASRMATGKPTPRIRVGLVAYRDRTDEYVTQTFDLSDDLDAVYQHLRAFQAGGGGDTPEHVGKGLADAVEKMSWTTEGPVARMIFLVGDAPSQHYRDGFDAATWAKKAIEKGIVVNTIRCGGDPNTEREFLALSRLADGTYASIGQTGGVVATSTPYDADLAKLNAKLASTSLFAGDRLDREENVAVSRERAAMPASAAADRAAFATKSGAGLGGLVRGGAIDLAAEPLRLEGLPADALPDELKKLSPEARKAAVEQAAKDRKAIEAQMTKLAKERDAWLAKNAEAKRDSFDEQVFETVKQKAKSAGVAY